MTIAILAILFFVILLMLIYINAKVNGGFKIETSWIALALSPVAIWMVVSGQVAEFGGFGLNFKLKEASAKPFSLNLEGDKIEPVSVTMGSKEGIEMIPNLVQRQVAAMALQVGRTGYYSNWAIREYLQELTRHSFFKYVVFVDGSGKFRGMMWAQRLLKEMAEENLDIVKVIESGNVDTIPDIITASVKTSGSKGEALKKMDEKELSILPVVDENDRYIGIVDRDKLTSSILVQLVSEVN